MSQSELIQSATTVFLIMFILFGVAIWFWCYLFKAMKSGKKSLTIERIMKLGFTHNKSYAHDGFTTHRFVKGNLEVEFTYDVNGLDSIILAVGDLFYNDISEYEVRQLDSILNDNSHA